MSDTIKDNTAWLKKLLKNPEPGSKAEAFQNAPPGTMVRFQQEGDQPCMFTMRKGKPRGPYWCELVEDNKPGTFKLVLGDAVKSAKLITRR